jgi:hypothetical protein
MDDDYKKNLLPTDFQNWNQITGYIGNSEDCKKLQGYEAVELPPFIKDALIKMVKNP